MLETARRFKGVFPNFRRLPDASIERSYKIFRGVEAKNERFKVPNLASHRNFFNRFSQMQPYIGRINDREF